MRNLTVVLLFISLSVAGCASTKPKPIQTQKPPLFKEFKIEVKENGHFNGPPSIGVTFRINNLSSLYPNVHHEENQNNH